jgi:hypothetical protein
MGYKFVPIISTVHEVGFDSQPGDEPSQNFGAKNSRFRRHLVPESQAPDEGVLPDAEEQLGLPPKQLCRSFSTSGVFIARSDLSHNFTQIAAGIKTQLGVSRKHNISLNNRKH